MALPRSHFSGSDPTAASQLHPGAGPAKNSRTATSNVQVIKDVARAVKQHHFQDSRGLSGCSDLLPAWPPNTWMCGSAPGKRGRHRRDASPRMAPTEPLPSDPWGGSLPQRLAGLLTSYSAESFYLKVTALKIAQFLVMQSAASV